MIFMVSAKTRLPKLLPAGASLEVVSWREKNGGAKFHNRFVLTELGGVSFGVGLDQQENGTGQTDDLNRMPEEQRQYRWNQYFGSEPAFEEWARFTVYSKN
jgi:hypothetical protein